VTKSRSRGGQNLKLSREQNVLFTRLERIAVPIDQARNDALIALGLVEVFYALEDELMLKRPLVPDPAMEREYAQLERRWQGFLDSGGAQACETARIWSAPAAYAVGRCYAYSQRAVALA
jgi:hypothetical protein